MSTSHHVEDIVDQDGQTHKVDVFVFNNPKSIKKIEDKKHKLLSGPSPQPTRPDIPSSIKEWQKRYLGMQSPAAVLNAARHAVQNVGISGLTGKDRMCAELSLLKRLGAKIPKKYERKLDKKRRRDECQRRNQDRKAGLNVKKLPGVKPAGHRHAGRNKGNNRAVHGVDLKLGTYRNGVQVLSAEDVKKVMQSRR